MIKIKGENYDSDIINKLDNFHIKQKISWNGGNDWILVCKEDCYHSLSLHVLLTGLNIQRCVKILVVLPYESRNQNLL